MVAANWRKQRKQADISTERFSQDENTSINSFFQKCIKRFFWYNTTEALTCKFESLITLAGLHPNPFGSSDLQITLTN